jgi:hypothetical protein
LEPLKSRFKEMAKCTWPIGPRTRTGTVKPLGRVTFKRVFTVFVGSSVRVPWP